MQWVGQFEGNVASAFDGVGAYFKFEDFELGGPLHPITVDLNTPGRIVLRSIGFPSENPPVDFLADIAFIGTGLQITPADPAPGAVLGFPKFTAGTITGIEVRFNDDLDALVTALSLAQNQAEEDRIIDQIVKIDTRAFFENPANTTLAVIALPNVSAAALGNAVEAGYNARSPVPLINFLSQFNHVYTAPADGARLAGFNGDDLLIGGPGGNIIVGNGGDDTLDAGGGGGVNQMFGGAGSDLYIMSGGTDVVTDDGPFQPDLDIVSYERAPAGMLIDLEHIDGNQSTGIAQGDSIGGVEGVIGSPFDDTIAGRGVSLTGLIVVQGAASSDLLFGGAGDDTIRGGEGSDTLSGGPGFDVIDGGPNADNVGNPGPPDIAVWAAGPSEVHFFNSQQGLLVAAPGEGVDLVGNVEALQFAGQLFGLNQLTFSNAQLITGGNGPGAATGGSGADLIFARGGNDTLSGLGGPDTLDGGAGNDLGFAGAGADSLLGGTGSDTLYGAAGNDTARGGEDADLLGGGGGDDSLDGGAGADTIWGAGGDDRAAGGAGMDTLGGGAGNDLLDGGPGNDELWGSVGNDTLRGGAGVDTLGGFEGNDSLLGQGGADELWGAAGTDTLEGGAGADRVGGGVGNDRIAGGSENDSLFGGLGDDTVSGGFGDDLIFGAAGNDSLSGGQGADTLFAGPGADTIAYGDGDGADVVEFFSVAEDTLELDAALWTGTLTAAEVVSRFGADAGADFALFFGNGDRVILAGQAGLTGLESAIDIV